MNIEPEFVFAFGFVLVGVLGLVLAFVVYIRGE